MADICKHGVHVAATTCTRCDDERRIAALESQLRALCDVATAALDMMLVSKERRNLVSAIREAKEAMK